MEYICKKKVFIKEVFIKKQLNILKMKEYHIIRNGIKECVTCDELNMLQESTNSTDTTFDMDWYLSHGYKTIEKIREEIEGNTNGSMKFYNEEDLENGNYERFCQEIDEISRKADEKARLLCEFPIPNFSTIEEARAYYGSMPFSEWENKMREKYGI